MAVVLRLQRTGKPNHAFFRVVAIEKRRGAYGPPLEVLGSYDPRGVKTKDRVRLKDQRVEHWLKVGARPSATVETLLKAHRKAAQPAAKA